MLNRVQDPTPGDGVAGWQIPFFSLLNFADNSSWGFFSIAQAPTELYPVYAFALGRREVPCDCLAGLVGGRIHSERHGLDIGLAWKRWKTGLFHPPSERQPILPCQTRQRQQVSRR